MSDITNTDIENFLLEQAQGDVTDFGYLLIPEDARLNDEALCNLKKKFKTYMEVKDE